MQASRPNEIVTLYNRNIHFPERSLNCNITQRLQLIRTKFERQKWSRFSLQKSIIKCFCAADKITVFNSQKKRKADLIFWSNFVCITKFIYIEWNLEIISISDTFHRIFLQFKAHEKKKSQSH